MDSFAAAWLRSEYKPGARNSENCFNRGSPALQKQPNPVTLCLNEPIIQGVDVLSLQAFRSRRVVTPEEIRPAAVLVEGERIRAVIAPDQIPAGYKIHDFGEAAILPGLVDSHVHINEPGRAEWEGFETATRAAAAGGYTLLVDMPLNCLPATTTVSALEAKRAAAQGKCRVDWAAWGE